jgi:hypothetical protein
MSILQKQVWRHVQFVSVNLFFGLNVTNALNMHMLLHQQCVVDMESTCLPGMCHLTLIALLWSTDFIKFLSSFHD